MSVSGFGLKGNKVPSGFSRGQVQQFTPEQMKLFQQMFGNLGSDSYLSKLANGDQGAFDEMEAPALQQFAGMQGNLASRFSGMGSGARNSSGFQNSANQQSADFAQQLQSNRMGIQRQAMQDLMGMSNELLGQRPYEQFLTKRDMPFWKQLMMGGVAGLGQAASSAAGSYGAAKGAAWAA